MMRIVKPWIITLLVGWGIFQILFSLLKDVIFAYVTIPKPYDLFFQIVGIALTILLTFLFTAVLVNDRTD